MPLFGEHGKKIANAPTAAALATALSNVTFTQTYSTASATMPAATSNTITDNSGGTASTSAIAAIGGTYSQAEVRNAVATLAAELVLVKADLVAAKQVVNKVIDVLQAAGIAL